MSKRLLLLFLLLLFVLPISQAQEGIVYGIFFYSPTCPHCHDVMDNHWGGIQARFGEQLQVLFVDVTTSDGASLMRTTANSLNLESTGVPQLIIGNRALVGSYEIPQYAPTIIQAGIEAGGVPYPNIPNIDTWFANSGLLVPNLATTGFNLEPANIMAVIVLVFMLASLSLLIIALWQAIGQNQTQFLQKLNAELGWGFFGLTILFGFGLSLSLLFGSNDGIVSLLALILSGVFIVGMVLLGKNGKLQDVPQWFVPMILLVGIITAGYLVYVEMSLSQAICGAFGDCNLVQQSDYAQIAGVPVGFIGLGAYSLMFVLVLTRKFFGQAADAMLFLMTIGGLLFSIYLTYLEPFVIGATCVWCLSSAIVMLSLLWLIVPRSFANFMQVNERKVST